ncbi:signal transduction histidine kinase, LytS [Hymenobacter roseosalivarius DSM 11622]|uniref:Signal transduction histidine kinase, LytS n=2 Tax=Hymenobacter roseosalivarius TaxID=89967 RepID=A0A1W1W3Y2_9BACT|nr:signal transduction histidine kinase, LytS [Hymenobacter roseosalivarius DSM 11622]
MMAWMLLYGARIMVEPQFAIRDALLMLLPHALITYLLLYGVLSALWRGNRWLLAVLLIGWLVASLIIHHGFRFFVMVPLYEGRHTISPDLHNAFATGPIIPVLVTVGVAACLRVYRQWRQRDVDNGRLTQENYQVELQLLKAQIHPHFLFNTLNNLYALTLKQSSHASEVVERLTGLLQFVVEQGNAAQVSLPDEVKLLRNYIALEQLRYGTRLTLEFRADNIPATTTIAPLLLLPLVENAFKHGSAEQVGEASIRIILAVESGRFTFLITNTKNAAPTARMGAEGIGLRNVQKRLQLLYPQRHQFSIEARDDTFTVRLTLQLPELIAATESQSSGRVAPISRVAEAAVSVASPLLLPKV